MLRPLKRLLTGLIAGLAIQPVAKASSVEEQPTEQVHKAEDVFLREMDCTVYRVDRQSTAKYVGPVVSVDAQREFLARALPKWRNGCFTANEETEAFVADRTH